MRLVEIDRQRFGCVDPQAGGAVGVVAGQYIRGDGGQRRRQGRERRRPPSRRHSLLLGIALQPELDFGTVGNAETGAGIVLIHQAQIEAVAPVLALDIDAVGVGRVAGHQRSQARQLFRRQRGRQTAEHAGAEIGTLGQLAAHVRGAHTGTEAELGIEIEGQRRIQREGGELGAGVVAAGPVSVVPGFGAERHKHRKAGRQGVGELMGDVAMGARPQCRRIFHYCRRRWTGPRP